jgi:asparaginyl-tRNA synthetase
MERLFSGSNTPVVTASDAEGAGALFRVSTLDLANLPRTPEGKVDFAQDFFGREAFLTVSGQLNVEAYCLALTKVYTFGPTFRAENSNTSRHLGEFWMIEPEIAFAGLSDNAALAEALLKYTFATLLNERQEDLQRVEKGCETRGHRRLGIRAHGLRRGDPSARAGEREARHRPVDDSP